VVRFGDVGLEAIYLASRALLSLLPSDRGGRLDLGSEVELTHLRIERTSEGSITPEKGVGELHAIYSGSGPEAEEQREHLSRIVEVLNERFGMTLGTADQLFFDQMEASWLADEHLVDQARANPLDNFRLVFADKFISTMVARMDDNEDLFKRVLDDREFQAAVMEHYLRRVFEQARGADASGGIAT
jgi:type I restriction enzyme R subunit